MPRAQRTKSAVHEALQRRAGNGPGDGFSGLLASIFFPLSNRQQFLKIGQIFLSPSGSLVLYELIPAEKSYWLIIHQRLYTLLPSRIKVYSRDRGKNVDAVWRLAELQDSAAVEKIAFDDTQIPEPKRIEHCENTAHVLWRCANEEIDVTREPWMTVERDGVTADNNILNVVRVQQYDELSQIGLQLRQEHSGAALSIPAASRGGLQAEVQHRTDHRPDPHLRNYGTSEQRGSRKHFNMRLAILRPYRFPTRRTSGANRQYG